MVCVGGRELPICGHSEIQGFRLTPIDEIHLVLNFPVFQTPRLKVIDEITLERCLQIRRVAAARPRGDILTIRSAIIEAFSAPLCQ